MTIKAFAGLVAAALIIAVALTFMLPLGAFAASCRGQIVTASWYGPESGNRTANGEHFDGSSMTAAHRSLPFGTMLRVTYRGKSVVVRINDRGPAARTRRQLDLSAASARRIGMIRAGVAKVCVERL